MGRQVLKQDYHLRETPLQAVTEEKDLGVFVDAELKFRKQAASKASQIMAVIKRSFSLLDKFTLPLLFKTLHDGAAARFSATPGVSPTCRKWY